MSDSCDFHQGVLVPNATLQTHDQQTYRLWDFRQNTHVALVWDPASTAESRAQWATAAGERAKTWNWLGVKILVVANGLEGWKAGVHLVDRFGRYIDVIPLGESQWDQIEKDLMYHEAKHC